MKNQFSRYSNILKSTNIIILVVLIMVSFAASTICWVQLDKLEFETADIDQNNQKWIEKNINSQNCRNPKHHSKSHTTFNCDSSFELAFKLTNQPERTNPTGFFAISIVNGQNINASKSLSKVRFRLYNTNNRFDLSLYSQKTALLYYD